MAGAPLGSKNAEKLKTDELKAEAYQQYCAHLAKGKNKRTWRFRHPTGISVTWETMEKYIKEDPIKFDPIHKEIAYIDGYAVWEEICDGSAIGTNRNANTASLQMVMRNKFGWDKKELDDRVENPAVIESHERLMNEITQRQQPKIDAAI